MNELLLSLYWDILPVILQVIGSILGVFLMWVANTARTRWGIEIEARHREALHSALMSGAAAALSRKLTWADATGAVLDYVRRSVPDALVALDPDHKTLTDLVEANLRKAQDSVPLTGLDWAGSNVPERIRARSDAALALHTAPL